MPDSAFVAHARAESSSRNPAIVTAQNALSFSQLESAARRGEQHLRECGIAPGDTVAVALGQSVEAVVLMRAVWRLGACACVIDSRWPEKEIARALNAAGCKCIIDCFTLNAEGTDTEPVQVDPDAPATVVFTSGSTGVPKPAVHSLDNHVQSALASNANIPLQPGDRWLL